MNTPIPWTLGEENVGGGFNIYSGPLRVAHTSIQARVTKPDTRPILEDEAKANARLIALAVNSHDELLAALKRLLSLCEAGGDPFEEPNRAVVNQALAAIAKAALIPAPTH